MRFIRSRTQPTRSLYQPQVIVTSLLILMLFGAGLVSKYAVYSVEKTVYVRGHTVKGWKDMLGGVFGGDKEQGVPKPSEFFNLEMDSPLNSLFNLFFPIDSIITYNTTSKKHEEYETRQQFLGRYASFSTILNHRIVTKYSLFPTKACDRINVTNDTELLRFRDRAIIILRGECTFVDKVKHIVDSGIDPLAILIANDEAYGGLITMYSNTFNQDGSIQIPIMFIDNENYKNLRKLESKDLDLELATADLGNWFGILVSMVLSPPLLIILLYLLILACQKLRKRQFNARNAKLVKSLPVFIYNNDHLVDANHFDSYLKITGQEPDDNIITTSPKLSPKSSRGDLSRGDSPIIVNGVDIQSISNSLHILTSPQDFYPSYKCSICLEKYIPLETKVLVLDCKHFYHDKCLSNWLINFRRSCPLCNKTLSSYDSYMFLGQRFPNYGSLDNLDAEGSIGTADLES